MAALYITAASVALVENGKIAWSRTFGVGLERKPIYQAASLSKFVAAIVALRLVQDGVLSLDAPVDDKLGVWKSARPPLTDGRPVTLRWLLSMRAGVNVPGFGGYAIGDSLPTLAQILNGTPPANSPRVQVVTPPGERYAYSGGGYEIVEALIADATGKPLADVAEERVFEPLGMTDSIFAARLPPALASRVATGHISDGKELPGGWRLMPELAAAGLWSTTDDLARLLVAVSAGYAGRPGALLGRAIVTEMLTPQGGGPYGLGAAVAGTGADVVLMKRGQDVGYQGYLILFPAHGNGMVVMTGSDNGSTLSEALIRRAGEVYGWPSLGRLED